MNLIQNYLNAFRYIFYYRSKASRFEFVSFLKVNFFLLLLYKIAAIIFSYFYLYLSFLFLTYYIISVIPYTTLSLRRLNDLGVNRLYYIIPVYGFILCLQRSNDEKSKKIIDIKHATALFILSFVTYVIGFLLLWLNLRLHFKSEGGGWNAIAAYGWGFISYLAIAGLTLPASILFDKKGNQPIKYHLLIHLIACILIFLFSWLCAHL